LGSAKVPATEDEAAAMPAGEAGAALAVVAAANRSAGQGSCDCLLDWSSRRAGSEGQ